MKSKWRRSTMAIDDITLEEVEETFELMDDWEDRYRYIIDLGRKLPPFPEDQRIDHNKVRGCVSQVWLIVESDGGDNGAPERLSFIGDSDAHIVKGLVALMMLIFSGRTRDEIKAIDARAILDRLGLADHLSPMRTNGLFSMLGRIGEMAQD